MTGLPFGMLVVTASQPASLFSVILWRLSVRRPPATLEIWFIWFLRRKEETVSFLIGRQKMQFLAHIIFLLGYTPTIYSNVGAVKVHRSPRGKRQSETKIRH